MAAQYNVNERIVKLAIRLAKLRRLRGVRHNESLERLIKETYIALKLAQEELGRLTPRERSSALQLRGQRARYRGDVS